MAGEESSTMMLFIVGVILVASVMGMVVPVFGKIYVMLLMTLLNIPNMVLGKMLSAIPTWIRALAGG